MKLCFLGLGIMGMHMAGHLSNKFGKIKVWNRSFNKSLQFQKDYNGEAHQDIEQAVKDADFIMMCLGNDSSVKDTVLYALHFIKKGATIIDHTTTSVELAKSLYKICKNEGVNFLDAPMTGGQIGAINGTLIMMCGGDFSVFEKAKNILQTYSSKLEYFGASGMGQSAKMVNQIAISGIIQSLAEAINFGEKLGVDVTKLLDIISDGAGGSWQMKNRHELMISKDYKENFGFPVEWMVKDLTICIEEAQKHGIELELTRQMKEKFKMVRDEINSRFDTSSIILLLDKK